MTVAVVTGVIQNWDDSVRHAVYSLRVDGLSTLCEAVTYLGSWEAIAIICLLLLGFKKTMKNFGVPVLFAVAVTQGVGQITKLIVGRPRPPLADRLIDVGGGSFPSCHAITSFAVYGLLVFLIVRYVKDKKKKIGLSIICGILTFAVGFTRVYLGAHYPSDVLAGWIFGVAAIAGAFLIAEWFDGFLKRMDEKDLQHKS